MPDVFVPGVKSRFDTDKMISSLMELERVPRNRVEKEVETLKAQKDYWQNLSRRITDMRESARALFSFRNPFNERAAVSSDEAALGAETTRESIDQNHSFVVKQLAAADKFVSNPLPGNYAVPAGTYSFSTGKNDLTFKFGGGSLQEFTDTLNRRGEGKIAAQLIAVKPNTRSFIIESLDTGAENRLVFAGDAEKFAVATGILAAQSAGPKLVNIPAVPAREGDAAGAANLAIRQSAGGQGLTVPPMAETRIALAGGVAATDTMLLRFETLVSANDAAAAADRAYAEKRAAWEQEKAARDAAAPAAAPPDEAGGGEAGETEAADEAALAGAEPARDGAAGGGAADDADDMEAALGPPPPHVDNLDALSLLFSDGSAARLRAVRDARGWDMQSYQLAQVAQGKTAQALLIKNGNTHRDIAIKDIQLFDPVGEINAEPRAPVSTARDAIIVMDGIEIERPTNRIDDLIPGVTLTPRGVSDTPVRIEIQTDTEQVKDSVITLVGNYNRLMVELNVLTRNDDTIIRELGYLKKEEQDELRKRLGAFSGDSALLRFKQNLQEIMTASYPTAAGERVLLSSFGITTDARRGGSYDPTKMRGYMEIDESVFNESLRTRLADMRRIFGLDSDGDKIVDAGLGFELDRAARPYVELGGVIAVRSGGLDTRISANERRIETMDRQIDAKEAALRSQYAKMEGAYSRMEQLSNSLDNFGKQNGKQ